METWASRPSGSRINRCGEVALITLVAVLIVLIIGLAVGLSQRNDKVTETPTVSSSPQESRLDQVIDFLSAQGISSRTDLETLGSPQNWAVKWVSDQDVLHLPFFNTTDTLEGVQFVTRYVLALFYVSLEGPQWTKQLNFLSEHPTCDWNKVEVSEQGQQGRFFRVGVACTNDIVNTLQFRE